MAVPGDSPLRGDIYRVDFDEPMGPHYAVVVTNNAINENADAVLVAVITSKGVGKRYPHEFILPQGILPKPSKVKCHNMAMVLKEELTAKNYVGELSQQDMQGLDFALLKALDLWV